MKVVVVGGGASGMVAAIAAAENGAEVLLIEKNERLGKKLLATGNGKCNYSNTEYGKNEYNENAMEFVKKAFEKFSPEDTIKFFDELGIYPRYESEGRVYPASEQAASVLDALRLKIESMPNIEFVHSHWIKGTVKRPGGEFGIVTHRNLRRIVDSVIIACGGRAGSMYGCEGDGHVLAEVYDHTVVEPTPALVQLTSKADYFKQLKGVRAKGQVTLKVVNGDGTEAIDSEKGEIQFTEFGISGICVFNLSGRATRLMEEKKKCVVTIDLFPEIEMDDFRKMMKERLNRSMNKTNEDFLNGLVNKKLIPVIMKACGVRKMTEMAEKLTEDQLEAITVMLKNWEVPISGSKSWNDAQTTSGGISLDEINPETMESRLVKGLYFAGEVVDVDGKCGGYNLQWAWTSGMIAGRAASENKDA